MVRGELLQIRVKLLVAVCQDGVPLVRFNARRTLLLQLLLEAGFLHSGLGAKMTEIIQ